MVKKADNKTTKTKPTTAVGVRLRRALYWAAVAGVWGVIAATGVVAVVAWDLPDANEAIRATRKPVVTVLASDGTVLARRGEKYGRPVEDIRDLPPALVQAVLATEDRRFYDHFGIDVIAIGRAVAVNLMAGGVRQGGSTLTQQAAKNLFLSPKRTFRRKARETLLALWLEAKFTKDQIFTIYINRVYFGNGVYGVGAAARHYFGVDATELDAYQSAMLAAMLKGPNKYNPFRNPDLAKARTEQVLANMVATGYMSEGDATEAKAINAANKAAIATPPDKAANIGLHFVDWARGLAADFVTVDRDISVITTLDSRLQRAAERAVARLMKRGGVAEKRDANNVALVAMAPDGRVLAMVGGKNWRASQFNRALQARRQPGSSFKPVVYLAALEAGMKPESKLIDEPLTIDGWSPQNFKREHLGSMTMAEALARSINTVAVKVSERAGRERVVDAARRLGMGGDMTNTPALALGVSETTLLELSAAYATFAGGGLAVWPYAISEVHDTNDAAGDALYRREGSARPRTVAGKHVVAMRAMLEDAVNKDYGTGKAARLKGRTQAGKTGTSQGYRDAWFIGFTPDLVAGVWLGNDNATPMKNVTGGTLPARLWRDFMVAAVQGTADRSWPAIPADDVLPEPDGPGRAKGPGIPAMIEKLFDKLFGD